LLWLQGGPGVSSMFSVFVETGPYIVEKNLTIKSNDYTWVKEFSVLYIDNPVGSGFSFTHNTSGLSTDEEAIADNLYEALQQFFILFSEYRKNDFYVTGESYAGKYIPAIGYKLHRMKSISNINFKGFAIGNAWIDPITMLDYGSFLKSVGLIDENQMKHFHEEQNKTVSEIRKQNYLNAFNIDALLIGIIQKKHFFSVSFKNFLFSWR